MQSNTAIGLGTGSTAAFAVARIGQLLKEGKLENIVAVPTSIKTYEQAKSELPPSAYLMSMALSACQMTIFKLFLRYSADYVI